MPRDARRRGNLSIEMGLAGIGLEGEVQLGWTQFCQCLWRGQVEVEADGFSTPSKAATSNEWPRQRRQISFGIDASETPRLR